MSNIIDLLEKLGADENLLSAAELQQLMAEHQLTEQESQAILARDHGTITELLQGRTNVCAILLPAEDDEEQGDEDTDNEQEESSLARVIND